jgi:hypothetical protein
LHIAFTDVEPPGGPGRANASTLQGSVKACGKSAYQATVFTDTLEMLDGLSALIHRV